MKTGKNETKNDYLYICNKCGEIVNKKITRSDLLSGDELSVKHNCDECWATEALYENSQRRI